LNLLDLTTVLEKEKTLAQVQGICLENNLPVSGYEIHHGQSHITAIPFLVDRHHPERILGCRDHSGNTWGTYLHGIFDTPEFRTHILNRIRLRKGFPLNSSINGPTTMESLIDQELSRLAGILRQNVDISSIYRLFD